MNKVFTPESILADGDDYTLSVNPFTGDSGKARKGTVAATLHNIALLNKCLLANLDASSNEVAELEKAVSALIPSLKVVGIFDLFRLDEWLNDTSQPGRIFAALLYLRQYPDEATDRIGLKIEDIRKSTKSFLLQAAIENLIAERK